MKIKLISSFILGALIAVITLNQISKNNAQQSFEKAMEDKLQAEEKRKRAEEIIKER